MVSTPICGWFCVDSDRRLDSLGSGRFVTREALVFSNELSV